MKKTTVEIICDHCKTDISPRTSGYPRVDILKVSCENVGLSTGFTYCLAMSPLLDRELYFCGFGCLKEYWK